MRNTLTPVTVIADTVIADQIADWERIVLDWEIQYQDTGRELERVTLEHIAVRRDLSRAREHLAHLRQLSEGRR